jgi:hypothetical protein
MSVTWVVGGVGNLTARIAYSTNGVNWTSSSNATTIFGYQVYGIAHSGAIWVAGGEKSSYSSAYTIGYSYDGNTWYGSTSGNSILSNGVNGVAYGNGKFVAVGAGPSHTIAYSTDGINWTGCASRSFFAGSSSNYGYCVTYKNNTWVAGGAGGTNGALIGYSSDGINWTLSSSTTLNALVAGIDWNGTNWVAVGYQSPGSTQIAYSSNLTTWTAAGGTFGGVGRGVRWNGSKFIASGQTNTNVLTSTTGASWSTVSSGYFTAYKMAINWNNGQWIIGQGYSSGSNCLLYSTDGTTWNIAANNPIGTDANASVKAIAYALPPPTFVGGSPTITSITNTSSSFSVFFTPGANGNPAPSTYYYSLNGGSSYINANSTTSPILISGVTAGVSYRVALIANNVAGNTAPSNISVGFIPYPCFLQGTKILRMNQETDDEEYVAVETLRRGDLIKTANHGYKAIELIGFREIPNPLDISKPSSRLYWLRKSKISGMRADLCVTGDHCILHKSISDKKKQEVFEYMGDLYVTEGHYRVPAFLDDRAEPYADSAPATIWHFALEHNNIYHNYGVMANGLLVESSSLHYMYKYSNMKMI